MPVYLWPEPREAVGLFVIRSEGDCHLKPEIFTSAAAMRSFKMLYGQSELELSVQATRYRALAERHEAVFGSSGQDLLFFSAPGRTEIGGNHTDHNMGRVLAAAVNLDTIAAVKKTGTGVVRLSSEGYDTLYTVDLSALEAVKAEEKTTAALIRGIAARMNEQSLPIGGFDACVTSNVMIGSGLSSSAAFEVLIATILDNLYGDGALAPKKKAQICQFAENRYYGKQSGLMDQTASAVGGLVGIDFHSPDPRVTPVTFDFSRYGYSLVVVQTGQHDNLDDEYDAIPREMKSVAAALGGTVLRDLSPDTILNAISELHGRVTDRAILRALHFIDENQRVAAMIDALEAADLAEFFKLIIASGESSWKLLQNLIVPADHLNQPITLALEVSRRILEDRGAWRIHGGGFAGTILAFVPISLLDRYVKAQNALFGPKACTVLSLRNIGAAAVPME